MTRYFFDLIDPDGRLVDEEGLEFTDMEAVEREATEAMADAARESMQRAIKPRETTIEVRDEFGPVMRVRFSVEVEHVRTQ
ncbi:hypothetical protein G8O24_21045 [Bradyrhizobium sp. INPA01-394B]|uniref:DUF6894 domain-containing protein n=1 Tax=Bradyrhizobium campsiandrae TaxID=1729892 RepID=A0ABR7U5Z1_9BRAD|nr:hypothetical protein [Bradyrhizobium campsiandrae]MBC9879830.1 hypothetical protein [Bradyrhizobium campsiandrae]MBC9978837.1 hypothetical protein [Bradyrhizobium campsiandrae]